MFFLKQWDHKRKILLIVYCSVVALVSIFGLILQTRLFILQQYSIKKDPEIESEAIKLLDLMLVIGQIFRGCGAVGICYYSIIAAAMLVYCLPAAIPKLNLFDYLSGNRSIEYLIAPEVASKEACLRLDKFLENVIESNINIRAIVLGNVNEKDSLAHVRRSCKLDSLFDGLHENIDGNFDRSIKNQCEEYSGLRGSQKIIERRSEQFMNHSGFTGLSKLGGRSCCSIRKRRFLNILRDQFQYLATLRSKKHEIWPSIRNLEWANSIKLSWKIFQMICLIGMWCFGQIVTFIGVVSSLDLIKSSNFGAKYQEVTFMDRLAGFNMFIITYICVSASMGPNLICYTSILDLIKHFTLIKSKVNQFRYKLSELDCMQNRQYSKHVIIGRYYQSEKNQYFDYDKSAIELYINYLIFRDEMKASIKILGCAATQIVTFAVLVVFCSLPLLRFILRQKVGVVAAIILNVIFLIDCMLLVCGAIRSNCIKYTKRIWNFVAFAEGHNLDAFNFIHSSQSRFNTKSRNYVESSCLVNTEIPYNFDYRYHLHGFISYHTIFLWRQLAIHEDLYPDHFNCKLFGTFDVSLSGILRYNYWVVSGGLIILSASYN